MNSIDETTIKLSKTKIALAILGTCGFVALGVWLLSLDEATVRSSSSYRLLFNEPMYARGLGLVSIVVFGMLALFFFKKLHRHPLTPLAIP